MTLSARLHFKTYVLLLLIAVFGPVGNILLSKGMKQIGAVTTWKPAELLHVLSLVVRSGFVWLGIASLCSFFVAYMLVLSRADYSYVQPASSIAYGTVAVLGHFLLGETVTPIRWVGVLIICLGVFVVGHTAPRTTEAK